VKQGNDPATRLSEKTPASAQDNLIETSIPFLDKAPGRLPINFHSAEFNCTDDLNDGSGNYRSFQPLDGIVTADMRHLMERRQHGTSAEGVSDDLPGLKVTEKKEGETEAVVIEPPLTLISRGRTLIIDTDAGRADACGKRLNENGLVCSLLVTREPFSRGLSPGPDRSTLLHVEAVSVTGAFGGFSAAVTVNGSQKSLAEWLDDKAATFDLVLDLQSTPSYCGDRLPLGYYAPGPNPSHLEEALAEMPEMRGRFEKPHFTILLKNRCFHGRSRKHGCARCLAVCPVGAIQAINGEVSINHHLCQGCGGCAMVCPADAIQRVEPPRDELLQRLQIALGSLSVKSPLSLNIVISDADPVDIRQLPGMEAMSGVPWVHLKVEEIAHAGLEVLLAALAYGAEKVLVACRPQNPPKVIEALTSQIDMAHAILQGLDLPADKIGLTLTPSAGMGDYKKEEHEAAAPVGQSVNDLHPVSLFAPGEDKRTLIRAAAQYLYEQSGVRQPWLPLPAGSPFGALAVDEGACTLCMACAAACPSGALAAAGDVPRLVFRESRCHQCGLCEETCPEGAMKRLPRLLCDPGAANGQVVLLETEPHQCLVCGLPFATKAMIDRIQAKLANHWMYTDERQLRRLGMCRTCRTRDALRSEDMTLWSQS